uniref:Uncharacterized protein n=1 Tax=Nelumbo nucifera TaxID=4432 RepID=A0A822YSZ2_NELNU|nr:TPA_asm: hypothetical protein HUJ06_006249 [Nelumbo nucifera]
MHVNLVTTMELCWKLQPEPGERERERESTCTSRYYNSIWDSECNGKFIKSLIVRFFPSTTDRNISMLQAS